MQGSYFHDTYISFKGIKYPYRQLSLNGFDSYDSTHYCVATESLEKALFDKQMAPVSKEAEFIDEHIFFYVKDNQICLDENSLREAIIYNLS